MNKSLFVVFLVTIALDQIAAQGRSDIRAKSNNAGPSTGPVDLMKYRMDVDTGRYIRLGTTDKCRANMRFFAVDGNNTAGMCDCDYYQCSRPSMYQAQTNQCYFAWSKGPCATGEWFSFDRNLRPVCETRGCTQGAAENVTAETVSLSFWFKNPSDGQCYESGSEGYCTNEDDTLLIAPGEPIPTCRHTALCVPLGRPEPQLCFPGNRRTHLGLCSENRV